MKRIISICISVMLVIGILAGCGASGDSATNATTAAGTNEAANEAAKEPVKLVWWGALPPESGPQEVADNFNKLDPNVQVEYYRYVNDDQGNVKLDMALAAGEKIDIFVNYGPDKREKRQSYMADITELCKKLDIDLLRDFGDAAKPNIGADGTIRTIPTNKIVGFIMYNKKMFNDAGVTIPADWTWDDLKAISKKLTKGEGADKVYGFLKTVDGNFPDEFAMNAIDQDAWLNDDATASTWKATPELKKSFEFWRSMMYEDKSMVSWEDAVMQKLNSGAQSSAFFLGGKAAMVYHGTAAIRDLKNVEQYPRDFITAFAPVPKVSKDQAKYYAQVIPFDDFAVNKNCKTQEEAVKFIKWYYTTGFDPMIKGGRLPLYKNYDAEKAASIILEGTDKVIDVESFKEVIFKNYENTITPGSNKGRAEIKKLITDESEAYFLGKYTIDQTMDNLQQKTDEILKNAK